MNLVAASFGLTAVVFAVLCVLSTGPWRAQLRGSWLAGAFACESLWSLAAAVLARNSALPFSLVVALEIARGLTWLLVLLAALSPLFLRSPRRTVMVTAVVATLLVVLALLLAPLWLPGEVLATALFDAQRWSGLLIAITGLVLVEQFARNTREDVRWHLKYIWLGIGLMFALDVVVWSMALLVGQIEVLLWSIRSLVNLLVGGLFFVGLQRIRRWDTTLFKSGGTLFFNTTLVAAGGYVMLMAVASYLIASGGQESWPIVEAVFLAAAVVLLAVAGFSDQFRGWFRVSVAKVLRRYQYNYRDVWLGLTRSLSEAGDTPLHDRIPLAMASYVNSNAASLWLREADGPYRRTGGVADLVSAPSLPHDAFFEFLQQNDWIFDVTDSGEISAQRLTQPVPPKPDWLAGSSRAWLVVPLVCNDAMVGFVVIARPMTPTPVGWEQLDILRASGRQAASYLAFEQAATRLGEMHQFEALNRVSAFVMHDLRHLVAQLALVVENAARHRQNPEFIDDALLTVESSVKRMNSLMEVLQAGGAQAPERRVDLVEIGREVSDRCRHRQPAPGLDADVGPIEVMANRERLLQALEHLVRNAQDATPASGSVTLRVRRGSRSASVEVADTGCGMDSEFIRTRLFKPFDTTKGQQGMGLGAYEAREIVRKLGGSLSVESRAQQGSRIVIELPLAPALAA